MATSTSTTPNILGPLTTMWAQPTSCTIGVVECDTCSEAWLDQHCYSGGHIGDTACFPPRTSGASTLPVGAPLSTWGIYSPGIVCPSGYTTACAYSGSQSNDVDHFYYSPAHDETAIGCCPSDFACDGSQRCTRSLKSTTMQTAACQSDSQISLSELKVPYTTIQNSSIVTVSIFSVNAPMLQLMYQSSDVTATTSTSTSNLTATPTATSTGQGQGVSSGAKAGIGVGVTLGIILAAAAGASFWWVKRRKRIQSSPSDRRGDSEGFLDGPVEMDTKQTPVELQGQQKPAELGGHDDAHAQTPVAELE